MPGWVGELETVMPGMGGCCGSLLESLWPPTGPIRCIGCGRFVRKDRNWNQCADCDDRTHEDF